MCEFLTKPVDNSELNLALSKVAALKPPNAGKGKILAILGATGGCGATFLAINTACELVCTCEQSAAIVDLDFCSGQVATYLDLTPSFTLGDLAETSESLDPQMLDRILSRHSSGVSIIARPTPLAQGRLLQSGQATQLITEVVSTMVDVYDYIILDGISPTDQNHQSLLRMADHILLVMNLLVPSIRNADRILQTVGQQGLTTETSLADIASVPTESSLDAVLLAINRLGRDSGYLRVQDVEQTLHRKTLAQIPDDWRTVSRSINAGEPLYLYAPNSKIRASLVELAMRLAENNPARNNQSWSRKISQNRKSNRGRQSKQASLLGKIFSRAATLTNATNPNRSSHKKPPRSLADVVRKEVPKR
jgi:pilus assembly protein CpaE